MRNVSDTGFRETQNIQFMFSRVFPENLAVYEIMGKNIPQMTMWRMPFSCRTTKATNTHSEYVILIAFPLQQWLHERASMLGCSTLPVLLV
jgi:hypothetical protein